MKYKIMKKQAAAAIIIAAAVIMQGCSFAERQESQEASSEVETTMPSTAEKEEQTKESVESMESPPEEEEKGENKLRKLDGVKIIISTDVHYLSQELTDYGQAFQHMVEYGDGRLVTYMDQITDAFLEEVIEQKPDALILTGDISSEGEKLSHEELAEKLRAVEEEGITVLVIPGNHDINNHKAAGYLEDNTYPAEYTLPQDFEAIYREFGYEDCMSRDESTLSYMYQLNQDIRVLMLDTCQYQSGYAQVGGAIMPDTYDWIEEQLEDAWDNEMIVLPFAHHNLLDQSEVYVQDCTIEHSSQLIDILQGWDISLFLSGHLHVQHMDETEGPGTIREIVTSSLTTPDCQYGILEFEDGDNFDYRTQKVDVSGWALKHGSSKMDLLQFEEFRTPFLRRVFQNEAYGVLQRFTDLTEEERRQMCAFYAELNDYYYQGRAQEIADTAINDSAYILWQEKSYPVVLTDYVGSIIDDADRDYNSMHVRDGEEFFLDKNGDILK